MYFINLDIMNFNELKTGKKIVLDDNPFVIIYHEHSKTGRAGAVLRTKLKNLRTGAVQEKIFHGSDKIEEADITKVSAQFLYNEGNDYYFMENETYDQIIISKDSLQDATNFLIEGIEVTLLNFNGTPINIELPAKVTLEVTEAPPGLKGDTQSGGDKLVTTETGLQITTPLFVERGDKIIINTERSEYVSKVN